MKTLVIAMCLLLSGVCWAQENLWQRTQFNYQMFCQGCHTPDGSGAKSVPRMKGHVGLFLNSAAGREYLVRVPGSATSALNDKELADVLNWILVEFAGNSLNENYRPYAPAEVARLRQNPLNELAQYRAQLLDEIASAQRTGQ